MRSGSREAPSPSPLTTTCWSQTFSAIVRGCMIPTCSMIFAQQVGAGCALNPTMREPSIELWERVPHRRTPPKVSPR